MAGQIQVNLTGKATRMDVIARSSPGTYAFEVRNFARFVAVTVTAAGVALEDQLMLELVDARRRAPSGSRTVEVEFPVVSGRGTRR
jgi:hypothetical protein